MTSTWDCIVVGGGAAGLSAALVLGRARRRTLVVDAGGQSNRPAHGIGGLLGHDGRPPVGLYAAGHEELGRYPAVELREGEVAGAAAEDGGFAVALAGGATEHARTLLLATGMDYRHPELPGIAERWGRSVFHCPFCHGWEVRDGALGVLGPGEDGLHRALLLRMWSDDVTLFTDGADWLDAPARDQLAEAGVAVDERRVTGLRGPDGELEAVVLEDGERRCDGLLVPAPTHMRSALAEGLGATIVAGPMGDAIEVDTWYRTSVPGLSAAGDITPNPPSVANAIAGGSTAAVGIVQRLMADGVRHAAPTV